MEIHRRFHAQPVLDKGRCFDQNVGASYQNSIVDFQTFQVAPGLEMHLIVTREKGEKRRCVRENNHEKASSRYLS